MKRIFIFISAILNVLFIALFSLSEHYGKGIQYALERRGFLEIPQKERTDFHCIGGWTNTLSKLNIECDAVFFGNSITLGSDFNLCFKDKKIINLGYGGNNTLDLLFRVNTIKVCHPKSVFVMAGTNDLFHIGIEEYEIRLDRLISSISKSIPNANIYIQSILPYNHELCPNAPSNEKVCKANEICKKISINHNATFIDLYSAFVECNEMPMRYSKDGVHLKKEGYDLWAKQINEFIY